MSLHKVPQWLDSERVIDVVPEISNRLASNEITLRRLNYVSGRTLTKAAMDIEVKHHDQHLALFGRQLSAGIIDGLTLSARLLPVRQADESLQDIWHIELTAGIGVTHYGDDIAVNQRRQIAVNQIPSVNSPESIEQVIEGVGIFLLQPIKAEDMLVDRNNTCQQDVESYAFDDQLYTDGARLLWFPWPESFAPLPDVEPALLRNTLSYLIYQKQQNDPSFIAPWEEIGVPLGLSQILPGGEVAFIDRFAVIRQGGAPLSVMPKNWQNGTPFLWQARIQGFTEHLQTLINEQQSIYPAIAHFRYLPPMGFLPRDAVDFENRVCEFFPSQFRIEAAPVPIEEVEVILEACASLNCFDLYQPDRVKIYVPVPQAFYEAELLFGETVDPVFIQTLKKLVAKIKIEKEHRLQIQQMAQIVQGMIDPQNIIIFTEQDNEALPDESDPNVIVDDYQLNDDEKFSQQTLDILQNLYDWIDKNMNFWSDQEKKQFHPSILMKQKFKGLIHLAKHYTEQIEKTNDHLDSGFMQLQAESYRLRQALLGNEKASRLSTSPALANILKGQLSEPTAKNINLFFKQAVVGAPSPSTVKRVTDDYQNFDEMAVASHASLETGVTEADTTEVNAKNSDKPTAAISDNQDSTDIFKRASSDNHDYARIARANYPYDFGSEQGFTEKRTKSDNQRFTGDKQATSADSQFAIDFNKVATIDSGLLIQPEYQLIQDKYKNVFDKIYTPIEPLRNLGLKERVYQSPSVQLRNNAVRTKASVYESLSQIPIDLSGLTITLDTNEFAIITLVEYQAILDAIEKIQNSETVNKLNVKNAFLNRTSKGSVDVVVRVYALTAIERKQLHSDELLKLEKLIKLVQDMPTKRSVIDLTHPDLAYLTRSGIFDPEPVDADEADYFSAGIASLEKAVATLRLVEQRAGIYELALIEIKRSLGESIPVQTAWQKLLSAINDKLAEYRHDLAVTRSLYEEEKMRVNEINLRRKKTLATQVNQIIFVRPRMVSLRENVISKPLFAQYRNPVPACLKEDYEATEELAEMLDLFREVPLKWLNYAKPLIKQIKRPERIAQIMAYAAKRAQLQLSQLEKALTTNQLASYTPQKYGLSINKVMQSAYEIRKNTFSQKMHLNEQHLAGFSWKETTEKANDSLSLADLIDAGKATSSVARKAIQGMENLEDVAVCLNYRLAQIEPALRLKWADQISIFDQPVLLGDLSILDGWGGVPFELQRELQGFVDWLFSRVDQTYSDALNLMNDLVRVCILLASHAPVSSIISGHLPKPVKGKIGDMFDLIVNKGRPKVGMKVAIYQGQNMVVQAIVEDIVAQSARVKVLQSTNNDQRFDIDSGAQARFLQKV
ncbi:hypothetical protein [Aliikangiella maris]|uniref:Uncharacterized protein n=2 Tax=Aliikangiella maris TaxID=3162458 RepID=A0ABV3MKT9_9GAMM